MLDVLTSLVNARGPKPVLIGAATMALIALGIAVGTSIMEDVLE